MMYPHSHKGTTTVTRLLAAWALILAWGLTLTGPVSAADTLTHATDLQAVARDAARRQVPVLILFSSPSCHFCARVKEEYLVPMQQGPAYRKRVIIREVTVGSNAPLTGFDGTLTTEAAFAASHKISIVPTVMVFDARGNRVGEPIVGLLIPDFYFGYLEAAIDEGGRKVRANSTGPAAADTRPR